MGDLAVRHRLPALRHALIVDGQWWLYYETARADGAYDLRLTRCPAPGV
ncbi:hypothetical protein [Nonomuraea sp. LPB2021202275-12-8]